MARPAAPAQSRRTLRLVRELFAPPQSASRRLYHVEVRRAGKAVRTFSLARRGWVENGTYHVRTLLGREVVIALLPGTSVSMKALGSHETSRMVIGAPSAPPAGN